MKHKTVKSGKTAKAVSTEAEKNIPKETTTIIAAVAVTGAVLFTLTAKDAVPPTNIQSIQQRTLRTLPVQAGTEIGEMAESAGDHMIPTWEIAKALFKTPPENRPDLVNESTVIIVDNNGIPTACRIKRINQLAVQLIEVKPEEKVSKSTKTYFLV